MSKPNSAGRLRGWLTQVWPTKARAVIEGYATLGAQHPVLLADIVWRAGVYAPDPPGCSDREAAKLQGRREFGLELVKLANADPNYLFSLLETKPRGERT